MGTTATSATFNGTVGTQSYAFRARAIDRAQNLSEWSNAPFTTTFYAWQLTGRIKDGRDVPLAFAIAQTQPSAIVALPSGGNGQYMTYGATVTETYETNWSATGFGVLPTTTLELDADRNMHFAAILPPLDNIVSNPDFESGLSDGWQVSDTNPPTHTSLLKYSGHYAIALGDPLFNLATVLNLTDSDSVDSQSPRIMEDGLGTIHVLWLEGDALYHRQRLLNGSWSMAENLTSEGVPNSATVAVDDVGRLHAMWANWPGTYYKQRDTDGTWSALEQIDAHPWAGMSPRLAVDHAGIVHAVWEQGANPYIEVFYTWRSLAGVWATPQSLSAGCGQHSNGSQSPDRRRK